VGVTLQLTTERKVLDAMSQFTPFEDLKNESDVEQKLLYPLLTTAPPTGLGFSPSEVRTKPNIKKLTIGKGSSSKLYFPDYLILIAGIPIVIVEAKAPGEDLKDALREARLYATELNARYPAGINPCNRVVVTDGAHIFLSSWDSQVIDLEVAFEDINPASHTFSAFVEQLSRSNIKEYADRILVDLREPAYTRPGNLLGGTSVRNEAIGSNTFGSTISTDFRHLFNPTTPSDRSFIARHGYITSKRRERYFNPINQIISAAMPGSVVDATPIDTGSSSGELLDTLRKAKELEREVLLLIGSVGSGKSTFVDRLREVAVSRDLRESLVWVRVDMNNAPVSPGTIYDWVLKETIRELEGNLPEIDFDDIKAIEKVFAPEIRRIMKGEISLLDPRSMEYKARLVDGIRDVRNDKTAVTKALIRYVCAERGRTLILVFDNCDKGDSQEQLLMFEVAQWLKEEFRCLVFLPLRDVTYDLHRDSPPLDTALKTHVFRIEPPLFTNVLAKRIELAFAEMLSQSTGGKTLTYTLPNGIRVEYPRSDQGMYLMAILLSLFEHDKFIRRTIVGLAGRDVRRALEIFLEFCTSGHISESEIFRIRHAEGKTPLPYHIVTRVLLRLNRRFYDGDQSYLCNLFQCDPHDARPDHFVRIGILEWLHINSREKGPSGIAGYHRCEDLKAALVPLGHDLERLDREIRYLVEAGCVITEHLRTDSVEDDDLLCISPSGWVHLRFLSNLDYLGACAEDVFLGDQESARRISYRIGGPIDRHYSKKTLVDNAADLVNYLEKQIKQPFRQPDVALDGVDAVTLSAIEDSFRVVQLHCEKIGHGLVWKDAESRYPIGKVLQANIDGVGTPGIFVEIEPGLVGLVPARGLPVSFRRDFAAGNTITVEVVHIDSSLFRADLRIPS
jgi:hypothetical protein